MSKTYSVHSAKLDPALAKVTLEGGEQIEVSRLVIVVEIVPGQDDGHSRTVTWVEPVADKASGEKRLKDFPVGAQFTLALSPVKEG